MKPLPEQYLTYQEPGRYDIDRMLHEAVQAGDVAQARTLLECGADMSYGLITNAVLMRQPEMVRILLEYEKGSARESRRLSNTALKAAKAMGLTELVPLLEVPYVFEPTPKPSELDEQVAEALRNFDVRSVQEGLAAGADERRVIYQADYYVVCPEHPEMFALFHPEKWSSRELSFIIDSACQNGSTDVVKKLWEQFGEARMFQEYGRFALCTAATAYQAGITQMMLQEGADPLHLPHYPRATVMDSVIGTGDMENQMEPIYGAEYPGFMETLRLLQEYGSMESELVERGTLAVPHVHLRLLIAAQLGKIDAVRRALAEGADVNARGWAGATALMKAARLGHIEMARLLLEHGADAQLTVQSRVLDTTALYHAVRSGSMEMVQLILPLLTNPELRAREVTQALLPAAARGRCDLIELLLAAGADADYHLYADYEGMWNELQSPLEYARSNGHAEAEKLLLAAGACEHDEKQYDEGEKAPEVGADTSLPPEMQLPPESEVCCDLPHLLHRAVEAGDADRARALLEHGAVAECFVPGCSGATPLQKAACMGRADIVELLLEHGASPNLRCGEHTALSLAAARGHVKALETLRKCKTTPPSQETLNAALHAAAAHGQYATALRCLYSWYNTDEYGLERKAYINSRDEAGHTAVELALMHGHREVAEKLCERYGTWAPGDERFARVAARAAANQAADDALRRGDAAAARGAMAHGGQVDEEEALLYVAARGYTDSVRLLLERGVDVHYTNDRGETSLMCAARGACYGCAELLLSAGARVNELSLAGLTALDMTAIAHDREAGERTAQLLREHCALPGLEAAEAQNHPQLAQFRLWRAIEQNDLEAARSAIAQETTLSFEHAQWHFRSVEMLRLLLTKPWEQADLDAALVSSCDEGPEAVRLLLAAGANPNCEGSDDEPSPLHVAAREESAACVRLLLEAGAEPNRLYNHPYCTAPMDALRPESSSEPACREDAPMDEADMWQNPESGDGFRTTLHLLDAAGALESELLDLGSPETPDEGLRLLLAAQRGDIAAARAALQAGANANARGCCGVTALMKAARRGDMQMAQLLLEHGADPHLTAENPAGLCVGALYQAARSGSADMVRLLLPGQCADEITRALLPAAARGYVEILRLLLAAGADASYSYRGTDHTPVADYWSPYRYALQNNHPEAFTLLVQHGAVEHEFYDMNDV